MRQVFVRSLAMSAFSLGFMGISPVQASPTPPNYSQLIAIPRSINQGLTPASSSFLTAKIGNPGTPLTAACFSCTCPVTNVTIQKYKVTEDIGPLRVTGLKPAVSALRRALDKVKVEKPDLYRQLKSAGMLCSRPIKLANGQPGSAYCQHSWGTTIDIYIGSNIDPKGDGKTQSGLAQLAPYLNAEGFYWGAGLSGSQEESMQFSASQELISKWLAAGGELRR
jgi:hypothetical protein